jgi:hypothetical protein
MSVTDAATESAGDLFRALKEQLAAGRLSLRYNYKRLQHIDCPVASEADGNIWAYAVLVVVLVAFWQGGWKWGVGTFLVGMILYFTAAKAYIHRRIRRRIDEKPLTNYTDFQRLWRFGGIGLALPDGKICDSPKDNWMELVRQQRAAT